ncbi:hypothetical protein D3C80_1654230 [compost metagenome]
MLGGYIWCLVHDTAYTAYRSYVHDSAIIFFFHDRYNVFHAVVHPHQVNIYYFFKHAQVIICHRRLPPFYTGIVVKTVYCAIGCYGLIHIFLHPGFFGDIGHNTQYLYIVPGLCSDLLFCCC